MTLQRSPLRESIDESLKESLKESLDESLKGLQPLVELLGEFIPGHGLQTLDSGLDPDIQGFGVCSCYRLLHYSIFLLLRSRSWNDFEPNSIHRWSLALWSLHIWRYSSS